MSFFSSLNNALTHVLTTKKANLSVLKLSFLSSYEDLTPFLYHSKEFSPFKNWEH